MNVPDLPKEILENALQKEDVSFLIQSINGDLPSKQRKLKGKGHQQERTKKRVRSKSRRDDRRTKVSLSKPKKGETDQRKKPTGLRLDKVLVKENIFEYMKRQNKPFNVVTLHLNLQKQFSVSQIKCGLFELCKKSLLQEKSYGKVAIFWINQDQFMKSENLEASLKINAYKISKRKNEIKALQRNLSALETECSELGFVLDNKSLSQRIRSLLAANSSLREEIAGAKTVECLIKGINTNNDVIQGKISFYFNEWRFRKHNVHAIADSIAENQNLSTKQILKFAGVEMDEDFGKQRNEISVRKKLSEIATVRFNLYSSN